MDIHAKILLKSLEDFFCAGLQEEAENFNIFGWNLNQSSVRECPGLNTLGFSMNPLVFLLGGLNPPHTHPCASELWLVTEGKLLEGWVTTGYILYYKVVTSWELLVIPPGVMHFQLNVGKGKVVFYAAFNSQNPRIQIIQQLFSTPHLPFLLKSWWKLSKWMKLSLISSCPQSKVNLDIWIETWKAELIFIILLHK